MFSVNNKNTRATSMNINESMNQRQWISTVGFEQVNFSFGVIFFNITHRQTLKHTAHSGGQ